jgi:hypothetical protein
MVGHPGGTIADWADVKVVIDGTAYTPFEAKAYVSNIIYKYNGSAYQSFDDETPEMEGLLDSYEGFWVEVLGPASGKTIKLLIPNDSAPENPGVSFNILDEPQPTLLAEQTIWEKIMNFIVPSAHAAPPERPTKPTKQRGDEWYVRLVAKSPAGDLRDSNNVLGQLFDSEDGYDSHDLRELASSFTPYLTIVFPHDDWIGHEDNYTSDYHVVKLNEPDQWMFRVMSDDPSLNVDLHWENVRVLQQDVSGEELMEKMSLEDLDTGELIKIVNDDGYLVSYSFNMDGKTARTFRWILAGKKEKGGGNGNN